jgi:uridine phosphorylase
MLNKEFPILEFDPDKNALLKPANHLHNNSISAKCVLCFFAEALKKLLDKYPYRLITYLNYEIATLPVYEIDYNDEKIVLVQACISAPLAAAQIAELTALGCKKYIACGSCGVLDKDIIAGHLMIPTAAVRDEGTSYHYIEPSREIYTDPLMVEAIEKTFISQDIPYIKAKTWTTDAAYRETKAKILLRKKEGCATVEMETATYIAVSRFYNVHFGQILYAGDNLDGDVWNSRGFSSMWDVREFMLRLSLDICLSI